LLAAIACLIAAATSYVPAMSAKHNVGLGVSSVEWLRQNGGNPIVSEIENWYYELNAPAKGGPALTSLPKVGVSSDGEGSKAKVYRPPNVAPLIHPALAGEGVWKKAAAKAGPQPPVLLTTFRSDPEYPQFVAGIAWIDASRTHLAYVPGLAEPPEPLEHRGSGEVPPGMRKRLVATFNGGFPLETSNAGLIYHCVMDTQWEAGATRCQLEKRCPELISAGLATQPGPSPRERGTILLLVPVRLEDVGHGRSMRQTGPGLVLA